jgi:Ca2+-transporting ATPase
MTVQNTWTPEGDEYTLLEVMGLACETEAYDPMEKAILAYCDDHGISKETLFNGELVNEYAFTNELKMMGHVWHRNEKYIIAAKGSPEGILSICSMTPQDRVLAWN